MNTQKVREILNLENLMAMDIAPFVSLTQSVWGLGSPRFYAMLNALASCLEEDEIYLEVGAYHGASAISALINNNLQSYLIDIFETNSSLAILESNLKRFNVFERANIFEMTFQEFFSSHVPEEFKVGLYYYDGSHTTESTTLGLSLGFPYVTLGGIIVADDISWQEVSLGINKFIGSFWDKVTILYSTNPKEMPQPPDEEWWAGTIVLQKIKE